MLSTHQKASSRACACPQTLLITTLLKKIFVNKKKIKLNIVTKKETANNTTVKCQSIIYQHPKNRRIHKLLTLVLKSIFLHSGQRVGSCGATKKKRFLLSLETMPTKLESFQYITQRNITTKKCKSDTISWRDLMSDLKFLEKANSKKWRDRNEG